MLFAFETIVSVSTSSASTFARPVSFVVLAVTAPIPSNSNVRVLLASLVVNAVVIATPSANEVLSAPPERNSIVSPLSRLVNATVESSSSVPVFARETNLVARQLLNQRW